MHSSTSSFSLASLLVVLASCSGGGGGTNDGGSGHTRDASMDSAVRSDAALEWHQANLTNYESYPDPGSDECIQNNGCTWAGMFAGVDGKQTLEWVMSHNIAAVHSNVFNQYELKTLRLRQGEKTIDVVVYDMCADSDCSGCCTDNASENGLDFLIDIEKYTMQRFGSGGGIVEFACLDCD